MRILLLTILNSLLMVTGQILWKAGIIGKNINNLPDIFFAIFSPFILCGLMVYACSTFLWLYVLNKADLSFVYPIQSLAFVFSLLASIFIFKENISFNRYIGTAIICLGVYLVAIK